MATNRSLAIIYILLIYFCVCIKCNLEEIEAMNRQLDELLVNFDNPKLFNTFKTSDEVSLFYNPGFEDENHEELIVTNISSHIDPLLFKAGSHQEFFTDGKNYYIAYSINSVIFINIIDGKETRVIDQYRITLSERILTFKILHPPNKISLDAPLILIIAIDVGYGSELRWYEFNWNHLKQFEKWRVDYQIKKLDYFQHDTRDRLLILEEGPDSFKLDIYAFDITKKPLKYRHLQRLIPRQITNLKLCPTYGSTMMIVQARENIFIYNYLAMSLEQGRFHLVQTIKFVGSINSICFHSGHIPYLITIGSSSAIFEYFNDEFRIDSTSKNIFTNIGDIYWIESIPVDTYREEVLLLIQLKNSSIFIFSWQAQGFGMIPLPFSSPYPVDLSKILVIPKVGFIYENKIVRIETKLRELLPPRHEESKEYIDTYIKLMEVFQKQALLVDELERRIEEYKLIYQIENNIWNIPEKAVTNNNTEMNEDTKCKTVTGAINITCHELNFSYEEITSSLEHINATLNEINLNMINAVTLNTTDISSFNNIEVVGELKIRGIIALENLTFDAINNVSLNDIYEYLNYHDGVIEGEKFFPHIVAKQLTLNSVNGIPINQIIFDTESIDYHGVNFSDITKLEVEGNLNFSYVNDIHWESLMKNVVRKSQAAFIPDKLIVQGTINAENVNIDYLNGLKYPNDYVQKNNKHSVMMRGKKIFKKLHVDEINWLKTINGIPIDDFIMLKGDTTLDKEITFHDLNVRSLEINGKIKDYRGQTIKNFTPTELIDDIETANVDVFFENLRVRGNVRVSKTINNKTWSDFDDLLTTVDDAPEITGKKTFLGRVNIGPGIEITSGKINGHLISEFMTLDTYQELPNLIKIDGNVTIGRLVEGDAIKLSRLLFENRLPGSDICSNKNFIFKVPPIVDKLSAEFINGNIPSALFARKLNESFSNIIISNISVKNLYVKEVNPQIVNGLNYTELLMANAFYKGKNPETLKAEAENIKKHLDNLYEKIINGSVSIRNLTVSKPIKTKYLNGILLSNIYNASNVDSVIFEEDVYINNLTTYGYINNVNFSEVVADAVLKTDDNIIITGKKKYKKIICESLDFSTWNGRSVDDILDPSKHQILTGPVVVNGDVIIEEYFDPRGKIQGIYFEDIVKISNSFKNNTYTHDGNLHFTKNDVNINNLFITGNVQDVNFNDFIESVVFLDSENVTIPGTIIFEDSISLNNLTIEKQFNDIDLEKYFRDVIRIDKPMSIDSHVIFLDEVTVNDDLIITKNFMANTLMGINFQELLTNAMYTNQPTVVTGVIKFQNLTFQSDIQVDKLNDLNMSDLITLHNDQVIPGTLHCQRITVGKLNIMGKVNGHDWSAIFNETLLLTGDQNITGNISFMGQVVVENFDSKLINGIDPKNMISPDSDEIIVGNFVFNFPIVLNGNLKIDGRFNKIDMLKWKNAVMTNGIQLNNDEQQIISHDWIVRGNVYVRGDIYGNDYLNDINIKQLQNQLIARQNNLTRIIREKKIEAQIMCRDLKLLKGVIDRKFFKYKYFEYFQTIKFNESIVSIHHFENDDMDYLFVSLGNCDLDCFVYNDDDDVMQFTRVIRITKFGYINRWMSFKYQGAVYILTLGEPMCNRSVGNLWKLFDNELILIIDFGNATDAKKMDNNDFLIIVDGIIKYYSLVDISKNSTASSNSWKFDNKNIKFLPHTDRILIIDDDALHELKNGHKNFSTLENSLKTNKITSFLVGIYQKEIFIYYDKKISESYIFISGNNQSLNQIVQTIRVNHPVSIRMINFDNYIENFLVFVESGEKIQIYEYKGIEGFLYRETIRIKAKKLYIFKLRIYKYFVKRNCLAIMNDNELIILEAKMYGEKIDMNKFSCTHY